MKPVTCEPDSVLCALRDLIHVVGGDPWSDFALTVMATLLGAVIGAFASWLFAINLARRAKADRVEELRQARADRDAERAEAAKDHRTDRHVDQTMRQAEREEDYRARAAERLDVAVARVVERIGEWDAAGRAFTFAQYSRGGNLAAEPPHGARARLLSSIRVAQMYASTEDMPPLNATFDIVTAREEGGTDESRALDYQNAADTLAEWRRGLRTSADAAQRILHRPAPSSPSED